MSSSALETPHSRVVGYFIAEFMIRTALPVVAAFDNDYEAALIFLVITTHNTQNLMLNQVTRRRYASLADDVPTELMNPISRQAIARSTNLPRETVRRKVARLIEGGFVTEVAKGLVVPAAVKEIPLYRETVAAQETNLRRLFSMVGDAIATDPAGAAALMKAVTRR